MKKSSVCNNDLYAVFYVDIIKFSSVFIFSTNIYKVSEQK